MFKNSILIADLLKNERHITKLMRGGKCIYSPLQEYKEEEPPKPEPSQEYFNIEALSDSTVIKLPSKLQYSTDKVTWTQGNNGTRTLSAGDKVYFKGSNNDVIGAFKDMTTGRFKLEGNGMSLLYGDNFTGKTSVPSGGFAYAFSGSTALVDATDLKFPPKQLKNNAFLASFKGCRNLTTAPELPALNLSGGCYMQTFSGCSKLNYIKAMFTTTPSSASCLNWVAGVASSGTFVKNKNATWNVRGTNGIPNAWTVQTAEP